MNVLYIAPFASAQYLEKHGETEGFGLAGSIKIEMIATNLLRLGHRVLILSSFISSRSKFAFAQEVWETIPSAPGKIQVCYPAHVRLRPFGGALNCVLAPRVLGRVLRRFEADCAIIYNSYVFEARCAGSLSRKFGTPFLMEIEDLPLTRRRGILNIKPRLDELCWRRTIRLASGFTAINAAVAKKLPVDAPHFLLPGIIDKRLIALSENRSAPFGRTEKILGYFGGLSAEKGADVLGELVALLPDGWKMVVTGSGPLAPELHRLSEKTPNKIRFFGKVAAEFVYALMCDCDCLLIPNEKSTDSGSGIFPFKALEFIVSGAHIIAPSLAAIGGIDCGFLQRWKTLKIDELVSLINGSQSAYLMESEIRAKTIEQVVENYSESAVRLKLGDMLQKIYEKRGAR